MFFKKSNHDIYIYIYFNTTNNVSIMIAIRSKSIEINDEKWFIYANYENVYERFLIVVKHNDFEIAIRRSNRNRLTKKKKKIVLICSFNIIHNKISQQQHDNVFEFDDDRVRNINNIKINCFFRTHLLRNKKTNYWHVRSINLHHNHDSIENLDDLQIYVKHQMTNEIMRYIERNFNVKSIDILIHFRNEIFDILIQIQNIYNVKKRIRHRRLKKYIFIQLLLKILHRNDWFIKFRLQIINKRIKNLFFINKNVNNIFVKNSKIIIIDCTYKTNKYRISLTIIINHIAFDTNFYIDFVFLNEEKKMNFEWLIQQINKLYRMLNLKDFEIIIIDRNFVETNKSLINAICMSNEYDMNDVKNRYAKNIYIMRVRQCEIISTRAEFLSNFVR